MAADPARTASPRQTLTIGQVCKLLAEEFDDISISKIRFLEDQRLISPQRTTGGYRLYSQDDVERLRTILRMQRDEFLPLAIIRDVLNQGIPRQTRRRRPVKSPVASSWRITRRGRNSSRCMRRIARRRSTSAWL